MALQTFSTADQAWKFFSRRQVLNDREIEQLENAEETILRRKPRSGAEAIIMTDVLVASILTGQRSDGLDVLALKRIRAFLQMRFGIA